MNVDELERDFLATAGEWSYIRSADVIDKTDYAIKMRLYVDNECFIQIYGNMTKRIFSFALVLNRTRIYGRDNDGGEWHRHPYGDPDTHDQSLDGQKVRSPNSL